MVPWGLVPFDFARVHGKMQCNKLTLKCKKSPDVSRCPALYHADNEKFLNISSTTVNIEEKTKTKQNKKKTRCSICATYFRIKNDRMHSCICTHRPLLLYTMAHIIFYQKRFCWFCSTITKHIQEFCSRTELCTFRSAWYLKPTVSFECTLHRMILFLHTCVFSRVAKILSPACKKLCYNL